VSCNRSAPGQGPARLPGRGIVTGMGRTYELVPDGDEPEYMDFDAELTELLSQA